MGGYTTCGIGLLSSWCGGQLLVVSGGLLSSYGVQAPLVVCGVTLSTNICLVKAMVFPVVMCGCESWTIKRAEH